MLRGHLQAVPPINVRPTTRGVLDPTFESGMQSNQQITYQYRGIDGTYADVRTILREALIGRATQIALIHNHPSGNAKPSQEDKRLTAAIQKASQTMNITLTDHIIVCDGCFYSFADEGLI